MDKRSSATAGRAIYLAYRQVYPKAKNVDVNSNRLLVNAGIQAEIQKHEVKAEQKFEIKFDALVEELAYTAFGSIEDILDWSEDDVKLIPKAKMKKKDMKFIDSISFERRLSGNGQFNDEGKEIMVPETRIKVSTLAKEKVKAADLLSKLLGYDRIEKESESPYKKIFTEAIARILG